MYKYIVCSLNSKGFTMFFVFFLTWKSNFTSERLMEKTNYAIW